MKKDVNKKVDNKEKDEPLSAKERRLSQRRQIEELQEQKNAQKFVDEYDYYFSDD